VSRELQRAAFALADQHATNVADAVGAGKSVVATVTTATANGAASGTAYLVKVTRRGVETTAAGYLAAYTPTVNDRVLCAYVDNQLFILGRLVGQP